MDNFTDKQARVSAQISNKATLKNKEKTKLKDDQSSR